MSPSAERDPPAGVPSGMPRVFISRRLPEAGLAPLRRAGFQIDMRDHDEACPRPELLARAQGAGALIVTLSERVDDELLEAAGPALRVVANYAVGYDNVDVAACNRRGVAVSNTPDVLSAATADQALLLMMAVARRLLDGQRLVAAGRWEGWAPLQLLGRDVSGATLGIVGLGRIGQALARRARPFDMRILYHQRHRDEEAERELGAAWRTLEELLEESDFVSLHTPLTEATRHLLGRRELRLMKETAVLVNTSRGEVVDEEALVEALRDGRIWGAGLDVFEREPDLTPGLAELPNALLTPHLGSATHATREAMARLCAEAVAAVLRGERVPHLLNPQVVGGPEARSEAG